MKVRTRITIDEDVYKSAIEYSKLDNRTFSALMQTAVEQMIHRYPKVRIVPDSNRLVMLEMTVKKLLVDIADLKDAIL